MREIRFRAWNTNGKKMLDLQKLTPLATELSGLFLPFDENSVLMQFTGLKDKNGTEIYEGDVVRQGKEVAAVKYDDVFPEFVAMAPLKNECSNNLLFGDCEVIGNIYENPELLKKPTDN